MDGAIGDIDRVREIESRERRDELLAERSRDRDKLEGRARLVRVGDGAVALALRVSLRVVVGVEARGARHCQHLARDRVEHDRGGRLRVPLLHRVAQHRLGLRLDRVVDREDDALALPLRRSALDIEGRAVGRLDHRLAARVADQARIQRVLEPREPVIVDASKAEHVRRDRPLRVGTMLLAVEEDARQGLLPEPRGLDRVGLACDVGEVRVLVQQRLVDRVRIDAEDCLGGERHALRVLHLGRIGIHGGRLLADRQLDAIAVVHGAATRGNRDGLRVLPVRHRRELRPVHRLQPEGAGARHEEEGGEDEEQQPDALVDELAAGDATLLGTTAGLWPGRAPGCDCAGYLPLPRLR